jgi:hypothetical protein
MSWQVGRDRRGRERILAHERAQTFWLWSCYRPTQMSSTAAALSFFLATTGPHEHEPKDAVTQQDPPAEEAPSEPSAAPTNPPRRNTAMFASGIVMTSLGALSFFSGIGILMTDSTRSMFNPSTAHDSTDHTFGMTLTIGGPILAAGGLVMAVSGGQRERAPGVAPVIVESKPPLKRRDKTLLGVGVVITCAGAAAMNLALLELAARPPETHRLPPAVVPLAVGGGIVTAMGLTMAIIGGTHVPRDNLTIVPILDPKSPGARATLRF